MTQMPSTVKVGPHVYTVVRKNKKDTGGANGYCEFDGVQICVKKGLRKSKAQEILLHELLHAATYPSLNGEQKYTDEEFATGLAPTLLQVIQDNPQLLEYLTQ